MGMERICIHKIMIVERFFLFLYLACGWFPLLLLLMTYVVCLLNAGLVLSRDYDHDHRYCHQIDAHPSMVASISVL